jgi:hypothetical protein
VWRQMRPDVDTNEKTHDEIGFGSSQGVRTRDQVYVADVSSDCHISKYDEIELNPKKRVFNHSY